MESPQEDKGTHSRIFGFRPNAGHEELLWSRNWMTSPVCDTSHSIMRFMSTNNDTWVLKTLTWRRMDIIILMSFKGQILQMITASISWDQERVKWRKEREDPMISYVRTTNQLESYQLVIRGEREFAYITKLLETRFQYWRIFYCEDSSLSYDSCKYMGKNHAFLTILIIGQWKTFFEATFAVCTDKICQTGYDEIMQLSSFLWCTCSLPIGMWCQCCPPNWNCHRECLPAG